MAAGGAEMNEPQYYIAQGQNVQGPFTAEKIRAYIQAGRVRKEMLFSQDGGPWVIGSEIPALFPAAAQGAPPPLPEAQAAAPAPVAAAAPEPAPVRRAPSPRRRAPARGPRRRDDHDDYDDRHARRSRRPVGMPGSVLAVVIIDFIYAALAGLGGILMLLAASAARAQLQQHTQFGQTQEGADVLTNLLTGIAVFVLVCAVGNFLLGLWLRTGQPASRVVHIVFSALALIANSWGVSQGVQGLATVSGIAVPILIIALLCTGSANDFFAERSASRARGHPRRRRAGGGGRRRRRY